MSKKIWIPLLLILIAAVIVLLLPERVTTTTPQGLSMDQTVRLVQAVSLLENVKVDEAMLILEELLASNPDSAALQQNYAIAVLTKIKAINTKIGDTDTTEEQKKQLRSEFPVLFDSAKEAINAARAIEPKNVQLAQLDVIREQLRADQMPIMSETIKKDLLEQILKYLQEFPGDAVLTAKLANIAEELEKSDPAIVDKVIVPLEEGQKANPRNAYLIARLFRIKVDRSDASLTNLVDSALEIAKPQAWLMNLQTNGVDIAARLKEAAGKVKENPEDFFVAASQWANVFVGATTIQKADADATADIEPLSLIRLDQAYRQYGAPAAMKMVDVQSMSAAKDVTWNNRPIQVDGLDGDIVDSQWFDWNLDLKPELLVATQTQVYLFETVYSTPVDLADKSPITLKQLLAMKISAPINCIAPVDLYEIRSELHSDVVAKRTNENEIQTDTRHTAVRDIVVGTQSGLQVIGLRFNRDANEPDVSLVDPANTKLPTTGVVTEIHASDIEADGDLDLVTIIDGNISIFENRGARNFRDANANNSMPPANSPVLTIAACDYDRDIDVDWMVSFADKAGLLENIQHGQFIYRDLGPEWKPLANARQIVPAELDGNVSWDWVARTDVGVNVLRTSTQASRSVSVLDATTIPMANVSQVSVLDINNDAKLDVLAGGSGGIDLFLQSSSKQFGFDSKSHTDTAANHVSVSYDVVENGQPTMLASSLKSLVVVAASVPSTNDYINLRVKGMADNNGGGRINEYAIGAVLELFTQDGYLARTITDDVTHFGLGLSAKPYSLRIIFPNGLTQTIVDPPKNKLIEERQELKGSCPFLYAWDGTKWQMVTDLLWNAPLGLQYAKGKPLPDRRWEYLLLPRDMLLARDGSYELRVTEELWEAAYFDHIALLAYDHPAGEHIASNEKVGPPKIAKPGVWKYASSTLSPSVRDNYDRDWTTQVSAIDGQYALPWMHYICQGLVDEHYVEIALPDEVNRDRLQLMLTGWYHPTDTSLNIGIDQDVDREAPIPPRLQAVDEDGSVQELSPFMGFPGGKPKTIIVDVSSQLKATTKSVRIATSCELYWDQIAFINAEFEPIENLKSLPIVSADLHYRGFSELLPRRRDQPHWYDYKNVSTLTKWNPLAGKFTRYGDCAELIKQDDDRMVVMVSGDEITLHFKADLKSVPEGFVREFVLHSTGWDKDADLNTIAGQSSYPLPFKGMKSYPAPLEQADEQRAVDKLNASTLTREQSRHDFWVQAGK